MILELNALLLGAIFFLGTVAAGEVPSRTAGKAAELFVTAGECLACHNGLVSPAGEDVSIGSHWRASMMANSARDPYWHAAVRRETLDHPKAGAAIQHECAACHMPMARYEALVAGRSAEVFSHLPIGAKDGREDLLAADGVSCSLCHQILGDKLGTKESYTAGFVIESSLAIGLRSVFGPYDVDQGRTRIMHSASRFRPARAEYLRSSEFCASCHTLITHALGPNSETVGELPEQVPYQEWLQSEFRGARTCQSCHMPDLEEKTPITGVLGEPRDGFSRHDFRGGNFFMTRLLNRYRDALGVTALPQELGEAAQRIVRHLREEAARLVIEGAAVSGARLEAAVVVSNLAGHKLPTAYPSRRVWIHFTVRDGDGRILFESGAPTPQGSIRGNDNDADAARFEPHYERIDREEQVQIYEAVMADARGSVTTGLLTAVRFVKDNRILPRGFDKAKADAAVAVHGGALDDADFAGGGDRLRYSVDLKGAAGPYRVEAELLYQPIGYRWARNLDRPDVPEMSRFVSMYDSLAPSSWEALARVGATAPSR